MTSVIQNLLVNKGGDFMFAGRQNELIKLEAFTKAVSLSV